MSLMVGIVGLCLIAGGLAHKAWDEHCWRRDERAAEGRLSGLIREQRLREYAEWGEFKNTHDEIVALKVADPWEVA